MPESADILVIGGGMAGASAAYELSASARVVLLEREARFGHHSTGRSAAMFTETYGNATVRGVTAASRAFFDAPPPGFAGHDLLTPRGVLLVARAEQLERAQAQAREVQALTPGARMASRDECLALVPILRPDVVAGGVVEPEAMDIDVDALHQGFLRGARARGAVLASGVELKGLSHAAGAWTAVTDRGAWSAPVVIDAAGAWADVVAAMAGVQAIGLVPKRRTAAVVEAPEGFEVRGWPMVIDIDETFYFKPDAGRLLVSPADETPVDPHDAYPDDLDVAIGIDRVQGVADLPVRRIQHAWAGLRSFVADKTPVVGFDPRAPGFFWLAGQGGYGIQTAPAFARLTAALVSGAGVPDDLASRGVRPEALAPGRLRG